MPTEIGYESIERTLGGERVEMVKELKYLGTELCKNESLEGKIIEESHKG